MLEGLVAGLLNRFIGPYVTNLNVNQLNIAIWSGTLHSSPLSRSLCLALTPTLLLFNQGRIPFVLA